MEQTYYLFLKYVKQNITDRDVYYRELAGLIKDSLTFIAGSLYVYMLYLNSIGNRDEAEMVKKYRTELFELRDNLYFKNKEQKQDEYLDKIADYLVNLRDKYNIHSTLLKAMGNERSWEREVFEGKVNDIMFLVNYIKNYLKFDAPMMPQLIQESAK